MKKLLSLVLFLGLIISTGCSDDEKVNKCDQLEAVTTTLLEKALTYGLNETVANCEAYADALQNWLDVAKNCDQVDATDIEETQTSLDELNCSAL